MTTTPRTWSSGETPTGATFNTEIRDQFNSIFDPWSSYTPIWTAASSNPNIGNGSIVGRYLKVGRTCDVTVLLTCGSTTTYGTGTHSISLPFAAASAGVVYLGLARLSGGSTWIGQTLTTASQTTMTPIFPVSSTNAAGGNMSNTQPETLNSSAVLRLQLRYQTAT